MILFALLSGGLPHQAKIIRKPEGVGTEIRNLIDGESQIMLKLEIQESKTEMAKKENVNLGEQAGTAGVLRLVKGYFQTWRTVICDSAFGS